MKRQILTLIDKFQPRLLEEEFDPAPESGQVTVQTDFTLVSAGTEISYYTGTNRQLMSGEKRYPYVTGYCNYGHVLAVGEGVSGLAPGAKVYSFAKHVSHFKSPAKDLFPLSAELDPFDALFIQMVGISLTARHAVEAGEETPVAVIGLGILGNLTAQLFREARAPVVGLTHNSARASLLSQVGIPALQADSNEALRQAVKQHDPAGPAICIEATGYSSNILLALQITRPRGDVVLFGSPRETLTLDAYSLIHKTGLRLIGAHMCNREAFLRNTPYPSTAAIIDHVVRLLASGRIRVRHLVTHQMTPVQAKEAYDALLDRRSGALGIVFKWGA